MTEPRIFFIADDRLRTVDYVDIMQLAITSHENDKWRVEAILYNDDTVVLAMRDTFDGAYTTLGAILREGGADVRQIPTQEEVDEYMQQKEEISPPGEN